MSSGHQRIKWRRNIAENFNRLSRVHERYRQTTDGRTTTYSEHEHEFTFAKNSHNWADRAKLVRLHNTAEQWLKAMVFRVCHFVHSEDWLLVRCTCMQLRMHCTVLGMSHLFNSYWTKKTNFRYCDDLSLL